MRPVLRNPCMVLVTGRLVMKNLRGRRRLAKLERAERMVDVEFSYRHSSKASMIMRHGGNAWWLLITSKGSTMSFSTCIDVNVDSRSGFLRIASRTRSPKIGWNKQSWCAIVGNIRLTLLQSEPSLEQKK